ncbi:MAG: hypothetical protein RML94_00040 [Bacteroidia bacterium]|nr:hypothetical protein [Bacteroidia bacterium]
MFNFNLIASRLGIDEKAIETNSIFISGDVPSKKNSKQWTGKKLISSKATIQYERSSGYEYNVYKSWFIKSTWLAQRPLYIGLYFVRKTQKRFDYNNIGQTVLDMMTKHKWIEDDSSKDIVPVFLGHHVDKKKPGVYIIVLYS